MRAAFLVLMLVVTACGAVDVPGEATPLGVVETAAPAHADEAIAVELASFEASTGVNIDPVDVVVHWTAAPMDYGTDGSSGLTYSCGDIWAEVEPGAELVPYVLAHELGHCARATLTGDGDGGHSDPAWWDDGGYVDQAHLALRDAGL